MIFFFFFFFFFFVVFCFCEFTLAYHSQIQPKARVLFSLWFAGVYPSINLKKIIPIIISLWIRTKVILLT